MQYQTYEEYELQKTINTLRAFAMATIAGTLFWVVLILLFHYARG